MKRLESNQTQRAKYEAPQIVYEGKISTRAGSTRSSGDAEQPVDLFNDD